MLANTEAIAMIAVRDTGSAAAFYEGVLGLQRQDSSEAEVLCYPGLNVYRSEFAGTNQATCAMWIVGDAIESLAARLKAKGVIFEHYDMPGLRLEGDVHVGERMKVAWFRDPDGNILSLVSG